MNRIRDNMLWIWLGFLLCWFSFLNIAGARAEENDPWQRLRQVVKTADEKGVKPPAVGKEDPWAKLRAIYLPFTEKEETMAAQDKKAGKRVAVGIHSRLIPYESIIREASGRFNVPVEIISAVIMVESGGDPSADADSSTAAGLMQTISATFKRACAALQQEGIRVSESPYDPRSSIMAGTWYLDRMYRRAKSDRPDDLISREDIDSWQYPLEYYYAGPGNGAKREPVVIIYSGGKRLVVDKPSYSGKVLKWAKILRENA